MFKKRKWLKAQESQPTKYHWDTAYLTHYFQKETGIQKATIATAYFSPYGLELLKILLKHNPSLSKETVIIYLSNEFSDVKAAELLRELTAIAEVRIVENRLLHAKVYLFEKERNERDVMYGSANFTKGGFEKNLEFVASQQGNEEEIDQLTEFFDCCRRQSAPVTEDVIEFYQNIEEDLLRLHQIKQEIKQKIRRQGK